MLQFPTTIKAPSYPYTLEWDRPVLESPFEDGSVQTRLQYTKGRDTHTFAWVAMTQAEYEALETFYKTTTAYGTLPFNFTYPTANGTKTLAVRFSDKPSTSMNTFNQWQVSITLKEV